MTSTYFYNKLKWILFLVPLRCSDGSIGSRLFFFLLCAWSLEKTFLECVYAQDSRPTPSYKTCSDHVAQKRWSRAQGCFCSLYRATKEPYHIKNLAKIQILAAEHADQSKRCPSTALILRQQAITSYRAYQSFLRAIRGQAISKTELEQIALTLRELRAAMRGVRVSFPAAMTKRWPQGSVLRIEGATVRCFARYPALLWTCQTRSHGLPLSQTCGFSGVRQTVFVQKSRLWLPLGCYRTSLHSSLGEKTSQWTIFDAPKHKESAAIQWPTLPRDWVARHLPTQRKEDVTKRPVAPSKDGEAKRGLWIASGISLGLGVAALTGGFVLNGVGQGALDGAKRMAYKETNWRASYDQALQMKEAGRALWIVSGGFAALGVGLGIVAIVQATHQEKKKVD